MKINNLLQKENVEIPQRYLADIDKYRLGLKSKSEFLIWIKNLTPTTMDKIKSDFGSLENFYDAIQLREKKQRQLIKSKATKTRKEIRKEFSQPTSSGLNYGLQRAIEKTTGEKIK